MNNQIQLKEIIRLSKEKKHMGWDAAQWQSTFYTHRPEVNPQCCKREKGDREREKKNMISSMLSQETQFRFKEWKNNSCKQKPQESYSHFTTTRLSRKRKKLTKHRQTSHSDNMVKQICP